MVNELIKFIDEYDKKQSKCSKVKFVKTLALWYRNNKNKYINKNEIMNDKNIRNK